MKKRSVVAATSNCRRPVHMHERMSSISVKHVGVVRMLLTLLLVIAAFTTFIAFLPSTNAAYEESIREGIFLVQAKNTYMIPRAVPTYLSSEDLTFFACEERDNVPVRLSVLCSDDNNFVDVPATKWGPENCYVGSVNLEDLPCQNAIIAADYLHNGENQRLTKAIRIDKVTGALQRVLDGQFDDGGWSTSLDTAFALYSIAPFQAVFQDRVQNGLAYMKSQRDETNKCWPQDKCQVSTTAMIAFLLNQAGYSDNSRILRDSTSYLQKSMNYLKSGETWDVVIQDHPTNQNNTVNTSCVYGYDSVNTSLVLPKYPGNTTYTISPRYLSVINVVCTENILASIVSSERGKIIGYAGDNFTYHIPGACWTFNNENVSCDLRTTAFALGTPLDADRKAAATAYLASLLKTTVLGSSLPGNDVMNDALFALTADTGTISSDQRVSLVNYLLYRQTNGGAWNTSSMYYNYSYYEPTDNYVANYSDVLNDTYTQSIVYTGFAVESLLGNERTRDSEVVTDAERWLSVNELAVSQTLTPEDAAVAETAAAYQVNVTQITSDPKRNAMTLYVLQQNTRPFLKSNPRIIILDKPVVTVDITNPTTFGLSSLEYSLPSELAPYVTVEQKDTFAPSSFHRITITQTTNSTVDAFGYLRIRNGQNEYAKIPILLTAYPTLNVTVPSALTVFGTSAIIPFNVTKSLHNYTCSLRWRDSGINSIQDFAFERNGIFSLPVQFTQSGTEQKDYGGVLSCSAVSSTFTFPFTIAVSRFISQPMSVGSSSISINSSSDKPSFSIKNLLDESIDVTIALRDPDQNIEFSDYFLNLYPGEVRNVSVYITVPTGENVSIVNAIIVKTFNVEQRIPLTADIISVPPYHYPLWQLVTMGVFGVGLVGLLGYYGYTNRKKIGAWYTASFNKESSYDKVRKSIEDYEQKEQAVAVKNMVQLLKLQGLSEKETRQKLVKEGFTEEEIANALKMKTEDSKAPASSAKGPDGKAKAPQK